MTDPGKDVWRRRFAAYGALRVAGLAVLFAGIAVAFSDWIRVGGWRTPGIMIAILGLALGVIPPALMKRGWRRADQ